MIAAKEHEALISLLAQHPPMNCGTCGTSISPSLGKLDQTGGPLDAAVYFLRIGKLRMEAHRQTQLGQRRLFGNG